jgi:hypothetical protein
MCEATVPRLTVRRSAAYKANRLTGSHVLSAVWTRNNTRLGSLTLHGGPRVSDCAIAPACTVDARGPAATYAPRPSRQPQIQQGGLHPFDPSRPAARLAKVLESREKRCLLAAGPVVEVLEQLRVKQPASRLGDDAPAARGFVPRFALGDLGVYPSRPLQYRNIRRCTATTLFWRA